MTVDVRVEQADDPVRGDLAVVEELVQALARTGVHEVDVSTRRRAEYSSDASNYRVVPRAVVFPRHADEVAATVEVCRTLGVPLTSRGAGTSIAGNAIGTGVVVDFSRHLNRVLDIDPDAQTAVVEPGAILDDLQVAALPFGLRFGPDPSTHARCTLGGMIGNNACGSRALAYGRTADNVRSLDVVTAAGARFTARRYGRDGLTSTGAEGELLNGLGRLVDAHRSLIRTEFGRFGRQVSGYSLEHLLDENGVDLARMLAGTEGTLAVHDGGHRRPRPCSRRDGAGGARLRRHGFGGRRRSRAAVARRDRDRGTGRAHRRRHPSPARCGVGARTSPR